MKAKILFFLIIISVFTNCELGTTSSLSNDDIDPSIRQEIDLLDKKVLSSIVDNNIRELKSLMSSALIDVSKDNIEDLMITVNRIFENKIYESINQFYIENSTSGLSNTVFSGLEGEDNYKISITSRNKKMFVSLIKPKISQGNYYILNIYGKYPEGWKLNIIQFGGMTIDSKTAPQLYSKAKDEYAKGNLVDAANLMFLNSKVIKPSSAFTYINEDEMKKLYDKIVEEINSSHEFPIKLDMIDSKPEILNIYPKAIVEGHFPMVNYLTNLDLIDTVALRKENMFIQKEIGNLFQGIDKNKKYVFYTAFSGIPDGKTEVPTYGFVQKIK